MGKNRYSKSFLSAASIAACAVFLVLLNFVFSLLANNFPSLTFDLTKDKLFKLSEETTRFTNNLEKNVTIYVLAREETFAAATAYNAQANQVFRQFEQNGPVSLVYIDYTRDPTFTAAYPDFIMKHGDILVESGGGENPRTVHIKTEELFNYSGAGENISIVSSRAEEAIYTAILTVTSERPLRAAVISGHGEYTMDAFTRVLEKNNYEVQTVNLTGGAVDPSFDLAVVIAPRDDFTEGELLLLDEFLYNGGAYGKTLFYCAGPEQPELPNLAVFLLEWGVSVGDGAVFETSERRTYNYQPFYAMTDYIDEEFSSLLQTLTKPMLVPVCRPLTKVFDYRGNNSAKVLLEFSASAGVRPSLAPPDFTADDAVIRGPVPAMILCRYTLTDRSTGKPAAQSNVLVCGSAAALDAFALDSPSFANTEYITAALNRLCGREGTIPLRPKSFTGAGLNLPRLWVNIIGTIFIVIIPAVILAAGLAVWIKRKHA